MSAGLDHADKHFDQYKAPLEFTDRLNPEAVAPAMQVLLNPSTTEMLCLHLSQNVFGKAEHKLRCEIRRRTTHQMDFPRPSVPKMSFNTVVVAEAPSRRRH